MSSWTETTLGEIASIITGPFGSQLHKSDYIEEGIPVVMPQNIGDRVIDYSAINRISEEDARRLIRYKAIKNDILYARRGDVEKHAFITEDDEGVYCGTGCLRVRVKSSLIDPLFLSFFLSKAETKKWLVTHSVGSNMQNLNTDILSEVPIRFPSIEMQRRIAGILQQIDSKIRINQEINNNLQNLAYNEYMHKFMIMQPNGILGNVIVEQQKSKVQVNEAKDIRGKYPFFTSGNTILEWDSSMVDGRNCFLNTGGNASIKFYVGESAYSTDTWCITAKSGLEDYLYFLLLSIESELNRKFFQGTGLKHLQKPLLKDRRIYIPTIKEINDFNAKVQPMMNMISDNIRENKQLANLRDWLLPMLMNGQAKVVN